MAQIASAHPTSVTPTSTNRKAKPARHAPLTLPAEGDGLVTEVQARAALQIGRSTLWRWAAAGRLRPVRFGRMVRFRISELRALVTGDEAA